MMPKKALKQRILIFINTSVLKAAPEEANVIFF
jgi:hypothetical protein